MALCFGQDRFLEVRLTKFAAEEGIQQLAFHSLLRDPQGFLWFGSQVGLVRFDGNKFKTYLHDENDPSSLSNDFVKLLTNGPGDFLTIFTSTSVDVYDPRTDNFQQSPLAKLGPITAVEQVGLSLWVLTRQGLSVLDANGRVTLVLPPAEFLGLIANFKKSLNDNLVIKTDQGFYLFNTIQRSWQPIVGLESIDPTLVTVFEASQISGSLFLGLPQRGLMRFDLNSKKLETIPGFQGRPISKVFTKQRSNWISCADGLYQLDEKSNRATQLLSDSYSLSLSGVTSLHEDKHGLTWLGSYNQGLFVFDSTSTKLGHFHKNGRNQHQFENDLINAICQDEAGTLWLGTAAGLISLNREKNEFKNRNQDILPNSTTANVLTLFFDKQNNLWGSCFPATIFRHDFTSGQTTYFQDNF